VKAHCKKGENKTKTQPRLASLATLPKRGHGLVKLIFWGRCKNRPRAGRVCSGQWVGFTGGRGENGGEVGVRVEARIKNNVHRGGGNLTKRLSFLKVQLL